MDKWIQGEALDFLLIADSSRRSQFPRLFSRVYWSQQWPVSSDPGPTNGPDLGHSDPQQSSLVATQCQNIKAMSF